MTTQTTPLQGPDDLFVEPYFGGYGLVGGGKGKRHQAKGTSKSDQRQSLVAIGAGLPRPRTLRCHSCLLRLCSFLHITQADQPDRLNRPVNS